jgi:cell division control protein 6
MGRKSFRDLLMYEETLFQDERVFDLDYIPKDFNYRDAQLGEIAFCMRPAVKGGRPANARITGPPATGKTTAVKLMFDDIEGQTDKVACVHVNCQVHASKFSVFSQIHKKVMGHLPPETGVPFPKVYEAIFKKLLKENKSLVVALDDMNYLFYDRHANDIIYQILRAHELYPGVKSAIIGVLSDVEFNYKLDIRVSSVYKPREIFFQPYSLGEMRAILKDRAKLGFYPDVISDEVLDLVANHAFERGDLRVGIELLRISALNAEAEASRHIEAKHVENALENSRLINLTHILSTLSEEELELMKMIADVGKMNSGELYEVYKGKTKLSYTKFYRSLDKLEALRLVDTKFTGKGQKGRTREIIARYLRDEVNKALEK